jgi:hypothetical protein
MNEYQKTKDYVLVKFSSDPLVNTITTLTNDLVDTNKETIYPVVNVEYKDSDIQEDIILFSFHVKALDQNDVYTRTTDSKLQIDTNKDDIFNETFNICQSFINSFRQYNSLNIELSSKSKVTKIERENLNDLSGHEFDIILSIPNEGSACPE